MSECVGRKIFCGERFEISARDNQRGNNHDGRDRRNFSRQRNFFKTLIKSRFQFVGVEFVLRAQLVGSRVPITYFTAIEIIFFCAKIFC